MERKNEKPAIEMVEFYYTGTDKQFNEFLKAVVHDYIVDDKILPEADELTEKSA